MVVRSTRPHVDTQQTREHSNAEREPRCNSACSRRPGVACLCVTAHIVQAVEWAARSSNGPADARVVALERAVLAHSALVALQLRLDLLQTGRRRLVVIQFERGPSSKGGESPAQRHKNGAGLYPEKMAWYSNRDRNKLNHDWNSFDPTQFRDVVDSI